MFKKHLDESKNLKTLQHICVEACYENKVCNSRTPWQGL